MTPLSNLVASNAGTPEEIAILRSVLYASLFDFPLTVHELRRSLLESVQSDADILRLCNTSPLLRDAIEYDGRFLFPAGRADLVAERHVRERRSRAFLADHDRVLRAICSLPYVRMVALSGSIAHMNLEQGGDLDLFVITRGHHVWSVTVAAIVIAKLLHRRRTVCVNFVVSDQRLAMEPADVFTANQILHLKPLVGRDAYGEFVSANPFVEQYYPNAQRAPVRVTTPVRRVASERILRAVERLCAMPAALVETACRAAYRAYLLRHAATWDSPDQVRLEPGCLKLHTHSHRRSTLTRFDGVAAAAMTGPRVAVPRAASGQ